MIRMVKLNIKNVTTHYIKCPIEIFETIGYKLNEVKLFKMIALNCYKLEILIIIIIIMALGVGSIC